MIEISAGTGLSAVGYGGVEMKHKPIRMLVVSLVGIAALCVVVFSVVTEHMRERSTQTIQYIGESYMSTMSRQVTMHLGATLGLRVSQVEDMAKESGSMTAGELKAAARARTPHMGR